ncbi:MAG: DoxX family protein, partial [Acidimicrobiales bacterium]
MTAPQHAALDNQSDERTGRWRRRAPWIVAAAFSLSGVVQLAHPATFTHIVPGFLPARTALVYASGVAELVCAAGLWWRARWAGMAAAALLVVIWPANLQMAINAQNGHDAATQIEDWIRFPLQLPLIWCALQSRGPASVASRGPRSGASRGPACGPSPRRGDPGDP